MAKTKQCKDCKAEIPHDARKCMHCGSKQPRNASLGSILLVLFVGYFVYSCSTNMDKHRSEAKRNINQNIETLTPEQRAAKAAERKKIAAERALQEKQNTGQAWITKTDADKMTNKKITTRIILSRNIINLSFPYNGPQRAKLTVREHPRWGKDIILSLTKGQFLCHRDCYVNIRFGDKNPVKYKALKANDNSTNILFISNYNSFVSNLQKVDSVVIEAPMYQEGNKIFEFSVKNFPPKPGSKQK